MRKEIRTLGIILGIVSLSEFAYSRPQRREVGSVSNWQCQWKGCTKRFQDGWLIQINHGKPGVDDTKYAKAYCLEHHVEFHKRRGEKRAVHLIKWKIDATQGGRTQAWIEKNKKR